MADGDRIEASPKRRMRRSGSTQLAPGVRLLPHRASPRLCRVRDGVRVDPVVAGGADDEGLAPHFCHEGALRYATLARTDASLVPAPPAQARCQDGYDLIA
jgi:hypothetical protein